MGTLKAWLEPSGDEVQTEGSIALTFAIIYAPRWAIVLAWEQEERRAELHAPFSPF